MGKKIISLSVDEKIYDEYKKHWLLFFGVLILLVAGISYFYIGLKWISYISFLAGISSILISLWQSYQGDKIRGEYENIINDYRKKYEEESKKSKKLEKEKQEVSFERFELKKFLNKINETLQRENISKEELIKNVSSSLKAVVFFKTSEDTSKKRALFFNNVYPEMGIYPIRAGLSILPPKRVPQDMPNDKIIKWFKKELEKRVPKDYEYNIPFITVINLNETKSFKRLQPFRKIQFSYLDKIPIEELAPTEEIISYLHHKKHLSPRDIIEIPNLVFLIEDYLISKSDLEALRNNNNKILNEIKKIIKSNKIKTTDFATIKEDKLKKILTKYVSEPDLCAKRIVQNANFWKSYFEHRLKLQEDVRPLEKYLDEASEMLS